MNLTLARDHLVRLRQSRRLSALLLIATIGLFWGGNWPAVRFILMDVPPFTLRAIGFSTGALLLLSWARWRRLPLRVPADEWPWLIATGLFTILGFNLATAFAQLRMPTSQAAIIAFTMPCCWAGGCWASASPTANGWAWRAARRACWCSWAPPRWPAAPRG
ncbi:EamA family transporter [Halomonas sp. RA08-2]|uniref:EamA family transporter n=1 Tax=Halomonas sp. RA08-2 TaxID=3440842 RepID=UPI003EED69B5